ncbi:hypothetical protein Pst134EA_032944 [Puccinia striiformis f. sp. tritici]|uniref:uncharacterized protein n=1 Tax=Puccinia striiformis f. sp. tritici TaxID=168172 RepID=UPI002007B833|nr:uncharacterized protein Pst134EA_032944 [Puccinia striiformis f. sp. tritici]KAH9441509.1 hypothetical protein Pst134EA_032944 [Puccinia striiformis f. sp. tritici]
MSNQSTSQLPSASNTVPDAPRRMANRPPAGIGRTSASRSGRRKPPPNTSARRLGTGRRSLLASAGRPPGPGRLVHDYSPNRNAFVARDELGGCCSVSGK